MAVIVRRRSGGSGSTSRAAKKNARWGFRRYATGWCRRRCRAVLEPIFERDFAAHSYGFRPKRGCKDALRRVDALLTAGYNWVVDADLKSYFDTIPHAALLDRVGEKVADSKVLGLLEAFLTAKVMETAEGWTPEEGTPQGAVISPLLSNIYLDPLDHRMAAAGLARVRYADDFVILCRSEAEARQALERVQSGAATAGRQRHPTKTRIVDAAAAGGFDFLGDPFAGGTRWPRRKSLDKRKDTWRAKPRRTHGPSLSVIITNLNRTLRGGYGYFQHRHATTFTALDPWVRTRRRSLLRNGGVDTVALAAPTFRAGRRPSSRRAGCSPGLQPRRRPVNPLGGKTTHGRAGCGRSACPVRREGERNTIHSPYPYPSFASTHHGRLFSLILRNSIR